MNRGNWKKPVVLEIFERPGVITVSDTLDAALMMLSAWPSKRTEAHMAAVMACRDVLTGKAQPALARADFIEAALEAGFHVQAETFLDDSRVQFDVQDDPAAEPSPARPPAEGMTARMKRTADRSSSSILSSVIPSYGPSSGADRGPVVWTEHFIAVPPADPDGPNMRELLIRLAQTLGAITMIVLQSAAGMLNVDIRRRRPNRTAEQS